MCRGEASEPLLPLGGPAQSFPDRVFGKLWATSRTAAALLITEAPPAATSSGESGGANPGAAAAVPGTGGEFYGEGWNNYGHDVVPPQPAKTGNGAESAVERHAEVVAAYNR